MLNLTDSRGVALFRPVPVEQEPKRTRFEYTLSIEDEEFVVLTKPPTKIDDSWMDLIMEFIDEIGTSNTQKMMEWVYNGFDPNTGLTNKVDRKSTRLNSS